MCEVILTCTLRADSGLRAKPRPVRTCSRFRIVHTSFQRRTKGAICSENMVWPCSSWNCSSGNTTLLNPFSLQEMVCSENMFPLELYREQVWTPGKTTNVNPRSWNRLGLSSDGRQHSLKWKCRDYGVVPIHFASNLSWQANWNKDCFSKIVMIEFCWSVTTYF